MNSSATEPHGPAGVSNAAPARLLFALALALLVLLLAYVTFLALPVMWLDEAMLYMALVHVSSPAGLVQPLPLYDQAAPIGFSFLSYLIFRVTDSLIAQKIPILLVSLLTVAVVWRSGFRPGKSLFWPFLAVTLLMSNATFAFLFVNYKHYGFEILAMALLVLGLSEPRWRWPALVLSGILALLFGNITPMFVVALGAVALYRRNPRELLLAGLLGVIYCIFYFTFIRHSVSLQLSAFSYLYENGFVHSLADAVRIPGQVLLGLLPGFPTVLGRVIKLMFGALFVFGFATSLYRRNDLALALLAIGLFLSALSFLRVYPWLPGRYSVFLLPLVIAVTVNGLQHLSLWFRRASPFRSVLGAGTVAAPLASLGLLLLSGATFLREADAHVRLGELPYPHLLAARQASAQKIIPFFIIQPQVQTAAEVLNLPPRAFQETDDRSSFGLKPAPGSIPAPTRFDSPGNWSTLLIAEQSRLGWTPQEMNLGNYIRWVTQQARPAQRVALILPRCFTHLDPDVRALVAELDDHRSARVIRETRCYRTLLFSGQP